MGANFDARRQGRTKQAQTVKLEREIEQRKQAEERFRLLVETAPTGILICDGQGRITEGNAQLQRFGRSFRFPALSSGNSRRKLTHRVQDLNLR